MFSKPLVSVMIATRDRSPELRRTLELLRQQRYEALELVVVDDGSKEPVEPIVRQLWPDATVLRYDQSAGQCQRRNDGFEASRGEFILQLDDDCCFNNPDDLSSLVQYIVARPKAGAVICEIFNGQTLPDDLPPSAAAAGCVLSFVGAAIMFRADAVRQ